MLETLNHAICIIFHPTALETPDHGSNHTHTLDVCIFFINISMDYLQHNIDAT